MKTVLTSSTDNRARFWDVETGKLIRQFEGPGFRFQTVLLQRGGESALTPDGEGELRLWDLTTGRSINKFFGAEGVLNAVAVSSKGLIAATGFAPSIYVWDLASTKLVGSVPLSKGRVLGLAFDSADKLQSITEDAYLCRTALPADSGSECRSLVNDRLLQASFSAGGRIVAAVNSSNRIHAWDVDSAKEVIESPLKLPEAQLVTLLRSGKGLVMAGTDRVVRQIEIYTNKQLSQAALETKSACTCISVRSDEKQAVVGTEDGDCEIIAL